MSVNLLDESQQVALAVGETPDDTHGEMMTLPQPEDTLKSPNTLHMISIICSFRETSSYFKVRSDDLQLRPGDELEMDHSALQALVAVLQADHALHVSRRGLLCGKAERYRPLRELLAALRGEVAQNFSLGEKEKTLKTQLGATKQADYKQTGDHKFLSTQYLVPFPAPALKPA